MVSQFELKVANKFLSLRTSAEARGKEFGLSLTSIRNLLKAKRCYYTGMELTDKTRTIDRVDNNKGYILGNVVACHEKINSAKSNLTKEQIFKLYKKLSTHGK